MCDDINYLYDSILTISDSKFESAVLGCTIEDQKQIKKRLTGLFSYFKSTTRSFAVMEEDEEVEEVINVNEAIVRSFQQQ